MSFSVYMKLKNVICLKDVQKCEQCSYEIFGGDMFGIFGSKWSPLCGSVRVRLGVVASGMVGCGLVVIGGE